MYGMYTPLFRLRFSCDLDSSLQFGFLVGGMMLIAYVLRTLCASPSDLVPHCQFYFLGGRDAYCLYTVYLQWFVFFEMILYLIGKIT